MPVTVWTVGHSTRSGDELVALLQTFGIELVADRLGYFDISVLAVPLKGPQFDSLPSIARRLVEAVRQGCLDSADGKWKPF